MDIPFPDPADPRTDDPAVVEHFTPAPGDKLARHPYVRTLIRQVKALRKTVEAMSHAQREMMNRNLLAGRHLEPLNPAPIGLIYPTNGVATVIHVDNLRMLANRVRGEDAPTIRILVGGLDAAPLHAHWVRLGTSELRERPFALPQRTGAFTVLETYLPVEVLR